MENIYSIKDQQVAEIAEMYVKIEKFKEVLEHLTILPAKIWNREKTRRIRMQARFNYERRIRNLQNIVRLVS